MGSVNTETKQKHLRSKANPEDEDEVLLLPKSHEVDFTPSDVINLAVKILDEQEKLSDAIAKAKSSTEINIDNAISMNKKKQDFILILTEMAKTTSSERVTTGRAYKFDANGEQKPYVYDISECTTISFDRNSVKGLAKKYSAETDKISSKLDEIEIVTKLDFTPAFDINDSFEDIVVS